MGYFSEHIRELVHTKSVMARCRRLSSEIDQIGRQENKLSERKDELAATINQLLLTESPIQPGNIIEWQYSNGSTKRGRVISIAKNGRWGTIGYEYRCQVINKAGKAIGFANVGDDKQPTIIRKK